MGQGLVGKAAQENKVVVMSGEGCPPPKVSATDVAHLLDRSNSLMSSDSGPTSSSRLGGGQVQSSLPSASHLGSYQQLQEAHAPQSLGTRNSGLLSGSLASPSGSFTAASQPGPRSSLRLQLQQQGPPSPGPPSPGPSLPAQLRALQLQPGSSGAQSPRSGSLATMLQGTDPTQQQPGHSARSSQATVQRHSSSESESASGSIASSPHPQGPHDAPGHDGGHATRAGSLDLHSIDHALLQQIQVALGTEPVRSLLVQPLVNSNDKVRACGLCAHVQARLFPTSTCCVGWGCCVAQPRGALRARLRVLQCAYALSHSQSHPKHTRTHCPGPGDGGHPGR